MLWGGPAISEAGRQELHPHPLIRRDKSRGRLSQPVFRVSTAASQGRGRCSEHTNKGRRRDTAPRARDTETCKEARCPL